MDPVQNSIPWLSSIHGFLLVDKPADITSQDVITRMQRILIERSRPSPNADPRLRKRDLPKMGHGGTLDPFATGLLVVALGNGTKLTRYLLDSEKEYEAELVFGARTESGDLTNAVLERTERLPSSLTALEEAARSMMGTYRQTPPMHSARKIDGKPLYELARDGVVIEREAVERFIHELDILSAEEAKPIPENTTPHGLLTARIRARVSTGTYIRTLAEDLALHAGSLAYLRSLRRRSSGASGSSLRVENAVTLEALASESDWSALPGFIPFDRCLEGKLPSLPITREESRLILNGLKDVIESLRPRLSVYEDLGKVALYDGPFLRAVFAKADGGWDFERVFAPIA